MHRRWWPWLPAALAGVAFMPVRAPFAWVAGALALLAIGKARGAGPGRSRGAWLGSGSAALGLVLAELLLPGPPPPPEPCAHWDGQRSDTRSPLHGLLGIGPPPSTVVAAEDMPGNVGYDGVYTIDEHGLRVGFPSDARDAVLFFGCSYTFGLNVADEETLPYRVGRELAADYVCHNFGYLSYGPQQMLAALEGGLVDQVVEGTPRHVVYQLIDSHVRRAVGNGWWVHAPRYEETGDGAAVRRGRLCDPPPRRELLARVLAQSAIYREVASHTIPGHVDTLLAIVRTARDRFQERFPGSTFEVLVWDKGTWKSRRMLRGLGEAGIPVQLVSEILPGVAEDYDCWFRPDDAHPTAEAQALLAEHVAARLRADG